jgi:hypothetical protein
MKTYLKRAGMAAYDCGFLPAFATSFLIRSLGLAAS